MNYKKNGLEYWTHGALSPFPHGFFTRIGGVSKGAIAALNCGYGADEARGNVNQNRALISEALGTKNPIQTVYQCHSADVLLVDAPIEGELPKCDALVTATPDLPIGILTADCAPILFADQKSGVIAAAHAGWRGAFGGVIESTVQAMRNLGAENISAVIGACISQRNYEVGIEFVEQFIDENPSFGDYFSGQEKYYFNLPRFVLDRLRQAGIDDPEWIGECTYADAEKYYSYRRATHNSEPDYGRLLSTIMIAP